MKKFLVANALADVVGIAEAVDDRLLVAVDYNFREICVDDIDAQMLELSDNLKEKFLHQSVERSSHGWVVEQRRCRSNPSIEMHDLEITVDVSMQSDLAKPTTDHLPHDSEGR